MSVERRRACAAAALLVATLLAGCITVEAPPCKCDCAFKASAPQVGKGCWVNGDLLVCPLVRRDLDIEPAYPSEDPRCKKLPSGEIQCEIHPGDPCLLYTSDAADE